MASGNAVTRDDPFRCPFPSGPRSGGPQSRSCFAPPRPVPCPALYAVIFRARPTILPLCVPRMGTHRLDGLAETSGPASGAWALSGFVGVHPDHPHGRGRNPGWTSAGRIVFRSTHAPSGLRSITPVGGEPAPLAGPSTGLLPPPSPDMAPRWDGCTGRRPCVRSMDKFSGRLRAGKV